MRNVFLLAVLLAVHSTLCQPRVGDIVSQDPLEKPYQLPRSGHGMRFLSPYGFGMGMSFLPPAMPYASPYMSGLSVPYQMPIPAYSPSAHSTVNRLLPIHTKPYPIGRPHAVAGGV